MPLILKCSSTQTNACVLCFNTLPQEALDLKLKEQRRLANAKEHNAQTAAANQALKDFEVQQKERQRLQDIAIEEYTAKKLWEQVCGLSMLCFCSSLLLLDQ